MPEDAPVALVKLGLLLHAVAAGVLTGSITHQALVLWRASRGRPSPRLMRLYPSVALAAWALVYALGAAIYPVYRVRVRGAWLDDHHPTVAALFDVKENLGALLGPLLLAVWLLARSTDAKPRGPLVLAGFGAALAVWFNLLSGLFVASVRSV